MSLLNSTHAIYGQEQAAEMVAELNNDSDDDWTYVAVNNPNPDGPKTAIIKIYEDNEFIANL